MYEIHREYELTDDEKFLHNLTSDSYWLGSEVPFILGDLSQKVDEETYSSIKVWFENYGKIQKGIYDLWVQKGKPVPVEYKYNSGRDD